MDGKVFPRNYCIKFAYQPKRRTPLTSYMQRLSLQYVHPDNTVFNKQILAKIYFVPVLHIPPISKHQSSIKPTTFGKAELSKNSHNQSSKLKREKKNFFYLIFLIVNVLAVIIICSIIIRVILDVMDKNTMQPISNHTSVLFKLVKNIKAAYYNQESDIWNNISSSINKVISGAAKKPLIILLFSNETTTMDSLAVALAYASSTALNTNSPLCLNPENFRDDTGEIIDILKENFPMKKVVIIRDILNINTKAIMALYNLCNRINPSPEKAIYILTVQSDNYQLLQEKLAFVQKQIYYKLFKSIDRDILMPFITCITNGVIIPVQPEATIKILLIHPNF